jgi:hypothetical protein
MLGQDELFARMKDIEAELGALVVPTLGVPITPNPLDQLFPLVRDAMLRHVPAMKQAASEVIPFILSERLEAIPENKVDERTPYWNNGYFPAGDARLAYGVVARHRPRLVIEVGCGNSTKFMRRAADDWGTGTRIVCIDPQPRADIGEVADEFIQASMPTVDLSVFARLRPGDVLFMDGSHLVMNGSDCVQFFLNVLPALAPGVWVHIHDVFLPFDYPYQLFVDCKSNEQYMVAMLMLHSTEWVPVLPIYFGYRLGILPHGGGSFWMRRVAAGGRASTVEG